MKQKISKNIIIDTCVLLDHPHVIDTVTENGDVPFLLGTIIDELDYNKSGDELINKNARHVLRELAKDYEKLLECPSGIDLKNDDKISLMQFNGNSVYILHRKFNRTQLNNDGKIIEVAGDYGLSIITRDNGMKVRANMAGIDVEMRINTSINEKQNSPSREMSIAEQIEMIKASGKVSVWNDVKEHSKFGLNTDMSTGAKIGVGALVAGVAAFALLAK